MARTLKFIHGTTTASLSPVKVERAKLYGISEMRATTPEGTSCHLAGINSDGVTVVENGCTKNGILAEDGLWIDRSQLKAVRHDGTEAPVIESSFNGDIRLDRKATEEDLLSINVSSVYHLSGPDALALASEVGNDIYTFPFSYNGGYESSIAFLVATGAGIFVITGTSAPLEFIGIEQSGILDEGCEEDAIDDELDFSMM